MIKRPLQKASKFGKAAVNRMSILQDVRPQQQPTAPGPIKFQRRHVILGILLLLSIAVNAGFLIIPPLIPNYHDPIVWCYFASYIPYLAACFVVLRTPPQERGNKLELGLIFVGALILRVMLLQQIPLLSKDSWRYLWDARVTLLGYSPYVYTPQNPIFAHLHDVIYDNTRYRSVPTIYPPGAQAFYILSYLIAPSNLVMLKSIFVLLDLVTCGALVYLLTKRGLDPRRVILYAWCPLPIVEFAVQGHLDAIAILFSLLAVISNLSTKRGSRVLTGFLVGMATLAKLYPVVLLLVVVRRRDWRLLATCFVTIFLAYLPYLLLGHGQVFGFFGTYVSDQQVNAGPALHMVVTVSPLFGWSTKTQPLVEYIFDAILMAPLALTILILRLRNRISEEAAMLILIGGIFFVSSHIYPWYTAALLPWIVVLLRPVWMRQGSGHDQAVPAEGVDGEQKQVPIEKSGGHARSILARIESSLNPQGLAIAASWYFVCIIILHYAFDPLPDWTVYYLIVYDVPLACLAIAAIVAFRRWRADGKRQVQEVLSTSSS
jgi:hypothetical protein